MKMIFPKPLPSPTRGRTRLMRLAGFLDTLAGCDLTFSRWYGMEAGCAVGLAIVRDPWFRAEGLRLIEAEQFADRAPVYKDLTDWEAICAFFELEMEEAEELFTAGGYGQRLRPSPGEISAKIRAFLRDCGRDSRAATVVGPSELSAIATS